MAESYRRLSPKWQFSGYTVKQESGIRNTKSLLFLKREIATWCRKQILKSVETIDKHDFTTYRILNTVATHVCKDNVWSISYCTHLIHPIAIVFCLLAAQRPSNMLVYLRDGSARTIVRAAHTEIELADQTFRLTQSQNTDTWPTSPSTDPI